MIKFEIAAFRCLFLLIILISIKSQNVEAEPYLRHTEFGSLRFSYSEISSVLSSLAEMLTSINVDTNLQVEQTIELGNGETVVTFSEPDEIDKFGRLPKESHDLSYRYYLRNGEVSTVQISLSDSKRELTVSGRDPNKVDAVFALLADKLESNSIFWGGRNFRSLGGIFALAVSMLILGAAVKKLEARKHILGISLMIAGLAIFIALIVVRFEGVFPGFVVYVENPSFLVRYTPQFTLIGLAIGIVTLIWQMIGTRRG